jgi:hypothetical protein
MPHVMKQNKAIVSVRESKTISTFGVVAENN